MTATTRARSRLVARAFFAAMPAVAAAQAVSLSACGSSPSDVPAPVVIDGGPAIEPVDASIDAKPLSAPVFTHAMVTVGADVRTYEQSIPAGYSPSNPLPVVFVLHGSGKSGDEIRVDWPIEMFSGNGAIFLYPDASGTAKDWDLNDPADSNKDVAFFDAMLKELAATYPYDPKRVFVAGFSRGAFFANQLGCRRGGVVRGVASFEGGGPFETGSNGKYGTNGQLICSGMSQHVAAFLVQADDDDDVSLATAQKSLDHWTSANNCAMTSTPVQPSPCVSWNGCAMPVVWCEIPDLGHLIWPDGTPAVWNFFAAQK